MRPVAFSGKKKKQQLKDRRARHRGEPVLTAHPPPQPATSEHKAPVNKERGVKLIREINGLKTVFAREDDAVVAARRLRAHDVLVPFASREEWERESLAPAHVLGMPTRPPWSPDMSKQQLEQREQASFSEWLQGVYRDAERLRAADASLELNYFEHNIDVWRQLWRACEMGDVLMICTDVRWPSFTFPYALVDWATSVAHKPVVLVLTKTDLVRDQVASSWAAAWSALYPALHVALVHAFPVVEAAEGSDRVSSKAGQRAKALSRAPEAKRTILDACRRALNWAGPSDDRPFFTVSAVGAPNAGKSAVINLLVEAHRVAVSATPGKTKHFQTLFVSPECRLLDSPGLMFPSVGKDVRVLQAIVGNYPVSQLREPFSAVAWLARRCDLVSSYHLTFPYDDERRRDAPPDLDHRWTSYEVCEALAAKHGFHLKGGSLDVYRSGKLILSEALRGILKSVFWLPPRDLRLPGRGVALV